MPEPCKCKTCKSFWTCEFIDGYVNAQYMNDKYNLRQLIVECERYAD